MTPRAVLTTSSMRAEKNVVLLTNGATPYRIPVFNEVARREPGFLVVYDSVLESGRTWDIGGVAHDHLQWGAKALRVLLRLARHKGTLIITHLNARSVGAALLVGYAGGSIAYFTDGCEASEREFGALRRRLRKLAARHCSAFIAGSPASRDYLADIWKIPPEALMSSYLCPLDHFVPGDLAREYDIVIGGRDVLEKNNAHSLLVCVGIAAARPLKVAVFGDLGSQTSLAPLHSSPGVSVSVHGVLSPRDLAHLFGRSKMLLVPSLHEPWGLTVHEALRCGCDVVASPHVAAARYLAAHYPNLLIRELNVGTWIECGLAMLRAKCSVAAPVGGDGYTIAAAASGLLSAVAACRGKAPSQRSSV